MYVPSPWHGLGETAVLRLVRARETSAAPPNSTRAGCASYRQHVQHREASSSVTHLEHGDRVVPCKDRRRHLKFHLRVRHRRQIEGECGTLFESTAADAKCVGRCAGMGAGAWRGRAQVGTTAHDAWGSPAHRRLKAEPASSCKRLKAAPARKSQAGHVTAAAAQGREVDVLGSHITRSSTISTISFAAGSGPPSRLERRWAS